MMMCAAVEVGSCWRWSRFTRGHRLPFISVLSWYHSLTLRSFLLCALRVSIYGDGPSLSVTCNLIARHSPLSSNSNTPTTSPTTNTQTQNKQTHNRANKHNKVPETKNIEEGSSRRNITRKHNTHDTQHNKVKKQGGGGGVGGKGQWNELDDGSLL